MYNNDDDEYDCNRLEVLNISNVTSSGDVVLNDERLLEMVQGYPFLFNPNLRSYQDPEYEQWAWAQIAPAFNKTYKDLTQQVAFSASELQQRWEVLKPIIKSLSKAYDINAIPDSLRAIVVGICGHLETPESEIKTQSLTPAQQLMLDNIPMIENLPPALQQKLESEIIELILKSELKAKGVVKNTDLAKAEYDIFMKKIGIDELPIFKRRNLPASNLNATNEDNVNHKNHYPNGHENDELQLLEQSRWVPIDVAMLYTRPCRVKMQRLCLEDYLPLADIKRFMQKKKTQL